MVDREIGTGEVESVHHVQVIVVSTEEASDGVAEFWSGDRLIGVTILEEGDLVLRIPHSTEDVVLGAQELAKALAEAYRLLSLY
jgi:hypothetical protein